MYPLPAQEFNGKLTPRDLRDFYQIDKALKLCRQKGMPSNTTVDQWDRYMLFLGGMHKEMSSIIQKAKQGQNKLSQAIRGII